MKIHSCNWRRSKQLNDIREATFVSIYICILTLFLSVFFYLYSICILTNYYFNIFYPNICCACDKLIKCISNWFFRFTVNDFLNFRQFLRSGFRTNRMTYHKKIRIQVNVNEKKFNRLFSNVLWINIFYLH